MTELSRVSKTRFLAFAWWPLPQPPWRRPAPPILEQIAKNYGLDSWGQVEAIRYTWNGEITGLFKVSRQWEWEPKTGKVSYEGKDKDGKPVNVTYMRSRSTTIRRSKRMPGSPTIIIGSFSRYMPTGTRAPL